MSIDKLNMTFADYQGPVLDANTMNKITSKIDETVDGVNNCDGGGGTGGSSGNEVVIGDESKITEDTKIFINPDEVLPQGNDVIDSLEGNETNKSPSVRAVKEAVKKVYSTEERIVGIHANGKPIYEKTFIDDIENLTILVENVDVILDYKGSGVISGVQRVIPYYEVYGGKSYILTVNKNVDNQLKLLAYLEGEPSTATNCNITLNYTKTTD